MNDSLPQLPEYDPHPNLWARIEADLQADELLNRAVTELPVYDPKPSLWDAIENDLTDSKLTSVRPLLWTLQHWAGLAAAAVLLFVGMWLYWQSNTTEAVRIEYAVEKVDAPQKKPVLTASQLAVDKHAEEFIARTCAEQKTICQRPEVHALRNQLVALTMKQQRIERERQIFGDDPALVQAQVKLETQRAEVTKELITLLRS